MIRKLLCLPGILSLCLAANVAVGEDLTQNLKQLSAPPSVKAAPPACAEPVRDPSIWDKSVLFGLNYTDGNTKTTNINLGGKVARDYENNLRGVVNYQRVLENDWFAGGGPSFAHDEIADLKYRVVISPSAGKYLILDENTKFSLEAGPSYVWEKLGDVDSNFAGARVADRLELKLTPTSKIYQFFEYLISFDDASQYLFNAEIGIESALNSYLSLFLSVKDYYINKPAENNVPNDVVTITALKVTL